MPIILSYTKVRGFFFPIIYIIMDTPSQVVSYIQDLTQKSQALQDPANSISTINGPLLVVGQGPYPEIIKGLTDIVSSSTTTISHMRDMPPIAAGAQSDAVFDGFRSVRRSLRYLSGTTDLLTVRQSASSAVKHLNRQSWTLQHGPHYRPTSCCSSSSS